MWHKLDVIYSRDMWDKEKKQQKNKKSKQQTYFHSYGRTCKANQTRGISFSDDKQSNNTYNSEVAGCLQSLGRPDQVL